MRSIRIISFLALLIVIGYIYVSGLAQYLNFAFVKQCSHDLFSYTCAHYFLVVGLFCVVCVLSTALSLPWAALLSILGGYLFGFKSLLFLIPSLTAGGLCAFLIARYFLGNFVQQRFGKYLEKFNDEINTYGGWYLLIVRLIPVFPFFLVNSVAALTSLSVRAFLGATLVGIIPVTTVFVFSGTQLAQVNAVSDIFSARVILALVLLVMLAVVPMIYRRFFARY